MCLFGPIKIIIFRYHVQLSFAHLANLLTSTAAVVAELWKLTFYYFYFPDILFLVISEEANFFVTVNPGKKIILKLYIIFMLF